MHLLNWLEHINDHLNFCSTRVALSFKYSLW